MHGATLSAPRARARVQRVRPHGLTGWLSRCGSVRRIWSETMGRLRRIAAVLAGTGAPSPADAAAATRRRRAAVSRATSSTRARRRRGAPGGELDRVARTRAAARAAARRRAALARLDGRPHGARRAAPRAADRRDRPRRARAATAPRYRGAREAARRLGGARGARGARRCCASVERLAAEDRLAPSRFPAVFLNLRRNTRTWTQAAFPRAGERRSFGADPAVFQYVPGRGMQLHPLASWGQVNARLRGCLRKRARLRRARRCGGGSTRSRGSRARRGGFVAWEYYYAYAQGSPPWMSGMAQATAVQALSRAARAFDAPRYARMARRALGAFETPPPTGVAVRGRRRPALRHVLVRADAADPQRRAAGGQRPARRRRARPQRRARRGWCARGDRAARAALGGFDTGAWSLYSAAGGESTLPYHQLTTGILGELCRRTDARGVLPRAAPLRALRARAAADRDRAAARALGAPQRAAALHALEGLGGAGARVRAARGSCSRATCSSAAAGTT